MGFHSLTPAIAVATSFALLACAAAPPVREPEVMLPAGYESITTASTAPLDRWWRVYGDQQLDEFVDRALAGGFDLRLAMSRLEEAAALRRDALSRFRLQGDPKASGEVRHTDVLGGKGNLVLAGLPDGVSLGGFTTPSVARTATATLPVSWELDLFGRRRATAEAADADLAAARFDREAARAALVAGVSRGLFEVRGLMAQRGDAASTEAIQRRLYDLVLRRAERGLSASSDVDRVAGDLAQAKAQTADLGAAVEASKRALLVLVGDGTEARETLVVDPTLPALPPTPSTLPGELLVRRPDVRQAGARLEAASGRVRLADLAFYPAISLQGALGVSRQSGGFATDTAYQSLGVGLVAPLFDRARLQAQLGQASARAEQAVLGYEEAVQKAYGEVDQTLVRLAADRQRVALLEDGAVRAQRAFAASQTRYQRGLTDLQETLDSERAERSARSSLTTARVEALQRSVQLFQALGGGWEAQP